MYSFPRQRKAFSHMVEKLPSVWEPTDKLNNGDFGRWYIVLHTVFYSDSLHQFNCYIVCLFIFFWDLILYVDTAGVYPSSCSTMLFCSCFCAHFELDVTWIFTIGCWCFLFHCNIVNCYNLASAIVQLFCVCLLGKYRVKQWPCDLLS